MMLNDYSRTMLLASQANTLKKCAENLTELMVNSIALEDREMAEIYQKTRDAVVKDRMNKVREWNSLYAHLKNDQNFLYSVDQENTEPDDLEEDK